MTTFETIKQDAARHSGMEMTAAEFKYSFGFCNGGGDSMLGRLVSAGVFEIARTGRNGLNIYRVK